jgi:hypothetical protein
MDALTHPATLKLLLALAVAAFVLISAVQTGSFPLGLAGSVNAREKPRMFWAMILLVLAFVLFLGFVA